MAPSSEKKQRSLTSFFTQKPVNGKSSQPPSSPVVESSSPLPRKRSIPDEIRNNNSVAKKPKTASEDVPSQSKTVSEAQDTHTQSHSTPHAGRFIYEASGSQKLGTQDEDENDPAVVKRNEEIHRKFVKKLGHPDSMLSWRSRRGAQDNGTPAGDDEEVEDEEEEEEPAPTKGKKKDSKTKKLTPMEVQFLDIKRKHMDTVLIVEVGYKFRFFGEDARIAAKELSIVCIPGKMRYDERKADSRMKFYRPLFCIPVLMLCQQTLPRPISTDLLQPASPCTVYQYMPNDLSLPATKLALFVRSKPLP